MEETKDITLAQLAAIVIKGFESNDRMFTALTEDITEIRETMATKEDIARIERTMATKIELAEVKNTMASASELSIVRHDVEIIKADTESNKGFAKEIDYLSSRVVVLEKHAGITPKLQEQE